MSDTHYIVQIMSAHGDWINRATYHNQEYAVSMAKISVGNGFKSRIVSEGKIVWESGE